MQLWNIKICPMYQMARCELQLLGLISSVILFWLLISSKLDMFWVGYAEGLFLLICLGVLAFQQANNLKWQEMS